ncbi:MAG TPA: hypothetical protein VGR46_00200 [Candidatus Limnocylindria bacterium]|nr:hypothetical protein [Candidatus Limnocylindria bacterium]
MRTWRSFHAASRPVFSDSTDAPASRAMIAGPATSHGDRYSWAKTSKRPMATYAIPSAAEPTSRIPADAAARATVRGRAPFMTR